MNKNIIFFFIFFICSISVNAQNEPTNLTTHFIEVTGVAETLVTPNEFTFQITLVERFENKEKITIESQEKRLKEQLNNLGINVQIDLTISNISAILTGQKRKKDVIGTQEYHLKVRELNKIEKINQIIDELNIHKFDLIDVTHSDLNKFRKETKMEAIKAAKSKATYMLEAIGEKVGKPIFIQEVIDYTDYQSYIQQMQNGYISNRSSIEMQEQLKSGEVLSFSKIKLKYNILARFEIK